MWFRGRGGLITNLALLCDMLTTPVPSPDPPLALSRPRLFWRFSLTHSLTPPLTNSLACSFNLTAIVPSLATPPLACAASRRKDCYIARLPVAFSKLSPSEVLRTNSHYSCSRYDRCSCYCHCYRSGKRCWPVRAVSRQPPPDFFASRLFGWGCVLPLHVSNEALEVVLVRHSLPADMICRILETSL